jgi:hypothetical protein
MVAHPMPCRGVPSLPCVRRFRLRYPHVIAGSIAASAPIWAFLGDSVPPKIASFYEIVTRDAKETPHCAVSRVAPLSVGG